MRTLDADIAVLGSGFGGSLMALVLSRMGHRVVVLDKATHPRFAIGESSTPTANMILSDLADQYDLPALHPLAKYGPWKDAYSDIGVGRKRGFSYFHHVPGEPFMPDPSHGNELLVAASNDPFLSDTHWLRADVDAFLAHEVEAAGVPLLDGTDVTAVRRTAERWHIDARKGRAPLQCTADFVIDATGRAGVLLEAIGVEQSTGALHTRSRAVFTHLRGVPSWQKWLKQHDARVDDYPYPSDEAALHHVLDGGWLWELRFDDGRLSVGLVLDADCYPLDPSVAPEDEWQQHVQRYPTLAKRFAGAELVDPPGGFVQTMRLQRRAAQAAGPGWAALPFTAGFIDPLHSTGIAHTLAGVERLAHLVEREGVHLSSDALGAYSDTVRRELNFVDALIAACYAALPSFEAWTASTMLYFAAVITYERTRAAANTTAPFVHDFLCADDETLQQIAQQAVQCLGNDAAPASDYAQFIEEAVQPYNRVGLFDPPVANMYPHTAAPV
jgi:FADH2 O2-dependent halogenase